MTEDKYFTKARIASEERMDIPRCDICMFPVPPKRISYIPKADGERLAICDACQKKQG